MSKKKIIDMYETLNIAGYTMAEQGYPVSDLIRIIIFIESFTGISGEKYKQDIIDAYGVFQKSFRKEAIDYEKKIKKSIVWRRGI
jgi:hypothetical protein